MTRSKVYQCLIILSILLTLMACVSNQMGSSNKAGVKPAPVVSTMVRESGISVTVYDYGDIVVHSLTAPQKFFANSTHIIESANKLVLLDTQFLLPMAQDYRSYAESLGKPIDRLIISHEHPDHFLGGQVFEDITMYALAETAQTIAEIGQAEIDEKLAELGPQVIADSFVVPKVLKPESINIDGIEYEFIAVKDAEAEIQVVTRLPQFDVVHAGDIVYSGVHLILAGQPPTWIKALNKLKAMSSDSTIVLAGHGNPGSATLFDENITYLNRVSQLLDTDGINAETYKNGLIDSFPDLGLQGAIDFVLPMLFPEG